ncbi:MAG: glycosyltransferase, partial [Caldanaerobacter sp.]
HILFYSFAKRSIKMSARLIHYVYEIRAISVESLNPDAFGGGDRVFVELFKRWQKSGVKGRIITSSEGFRLFTSCKLYSNYDVLSRSIVENSHSLIMIPIIWFVRAFKVFKRWNGTIKKPTVIYTPGDFICDVIPACLLRITHRNVIWATHIHYIIPPPWKRKLSFITDLFSFLLQRISFLIIGTFADIVIVVNSYVKSNLTKMGIPRGKIYKSSCGIDFKIIQSISPNNNYQYEGCFVGRLHPGKGTYDLIEIWSKVVKEISDAKLAVVGGGDPFYVNRLIEEIKEKHLEKNVHLLGFLPFPFSVIKSSKLLLYPDHEAGYGWGIAIAEALACGVPAVAYDLPVYREVYENKIRLIKPWNTNEFAREVIILLKDDKKRHELGEIGRKYVKKYDWDLVAGDLLRLFNLKVKEKMAQMLSKDSSHK